MRRGDQALFYHSNAKPSGVVGVVEVRACRWCGPVEWAGIAVGRDRRSLPACLSPADPKLTVTPRIALLPSPFHLRSAAQIVKEAYPDHTQYDSTR